MRSISTSAQINTHFQYGNDINGNTLSANNDPSLNNVNISFDQNRKDSLTPYEKILYESQHDVRFTEEEKDSQRIGFYRIYQSIGYGNFSLVKLGMHQLAKEKVAIKVLDKTKLNDKIQRLLLREITSMEKLAHPNVIRLYEVIQTPREIHLVMEYAPGGDLYTRLSRTGKVPESEAKQIFAQIVAAIDHIHSKGIIHRDIKSENVFFANEHLIKLGDFGFSTYSEKNQKLTTFCGSPPYAAPELYRDDTYIGIYVDIWAMGILLYFMVTAQMPFRAENVGKLKKSILDGNYVIPGYVSNQCQELIRGLLNYEITERWSIETIRLCSWLNNQKFPREFSSFTLNINDQPIFSNITAISTLEKETYSRLKKLGITSEVLQVINNNSDDKHLSIRDNINGTYRILLHRLQKQSSVLERDDSFDERFNENFSLPNNLLSFHHETNEQQTKTHLNQSEKHNTKVCIIL